MLGCLVWVPASSACPNLAHGAKSKLNFATAADQQEAAAAVEQAKPAAWAPLLGSLDLQQLLAAYGPAG